MENRHRKKGVWQKQPVQRSSSEPIAIAAAKPSRLRIAVMGATAVGKSCIIRRLLEKDFTDRHFPTINEKYEKEIVIWGRQVDIDIVDTTGSSMFSVMRIQTIRQSDAFILVYALNDKVTFHQMLKLREEILEEKRRNDVQILVVGNKCDAKPPENRDMCEDSRTKFRSAVSTDLEVSAKTCYNVTEILPKLLKLLGFDSTKKSRCKRGMTASMS